MIKNSVFIISIIIFVLNISFTQSIQKETRTFSLGQEKVWVHIYDKPGAEVTFINLHDNESTSAEAGLAFINKYGGHLIELQHGRGREVVVRLNGELNRFDPNRMFTDKGLKASLKYYQNTKDDIFNIAATFRDTIVDLLTFSGNEFIIALHNNSPDKMTIKDFKPGEWYGKDTKEVFINLQRDVDSFFVVTHRDLFTALSSAGYNVALRAQNPPDRGMLIDYSARLGVQHVTVETEHGELTEQLEMLEILWKIITKNNNFLGRH